MILFDERTHTYTEDAYPLPSVSRILEAEGLMDKRFFRPEAAERGRQVHELTAALDRGEEPDIRRTSPLYGYLSAWLAFKAAYGVQVLEVERIAGGRSFGCAGTIDRLLRIEGQLYVTDLKTGGAHPWHALQLAGYAYLLGEPCGRMNVYLKADGRFGQPVVHHREEDRLLFEAALRLYRFKNTRYLKAQEALQELRVKIPGLAGLGAWRTQLP